MEGARGEGDGRERKRISVIVSQPRAQRVGTRESKPAKNTSGAIYMVGPQWHTSLALGFPALLSMLHHC